MWTRFWVNSKERQLWWLKACQWCLKPTYNHTNALLTLIHCSVNTLRVLQVPCEDTQSTLSEQSVSQEVHDELSIQVTLLSRCQFLSVISGILKVLKRQGLLMFDHHLEIQVAPAILVLITWKHWAVSPNRHWWCGQSRVSKHSQASFLL